MKNPMRTRGTTIRDETAYKVWQIDRQHIGLMILSLLMGVCFPDSPCPAGVFVLVLIAWPIRRARI